MLKAGGFGFGIVGILGYFDKLTVPILTDDTFSRVVGSESDVAALGLNFGLVVFAPALFILSYILPHPGESKASIVI